MSNAKPLVVGGVVILFLGMVIGSATKPTPPVPEPEVQVKMKYIEKEVVKEVPVPAALPEACIEMIERIKPLTENLGVIDTAAGLINLEAGELQRNAVVADGQAMVENNEVISDNVAVMDAAVVDKLEIQTAFNNKMVQCEQALE